jgi:2,2-dialkylglycine decarboxylase (pyruvate)
MADLSARMAEMKAPKNVPPEIEKRREELWSLVEHHVVRHAGPYDPVLIEKARGAWVWDDAGRPILDFVSGQLCSTLGHNNPEIIAAIEETCRNAIHLFSWSLSPVVVELCSELAAMLPANLQKSLPLSTGGESNEAAIRMAKLKTGKWEIVGLDASWHGATAGAGAHTYAGARKGYGPMQPGALSLPTPNAYHCPMRHCDGVCDNTCLEAGFAMIDRQSTGNLAACIAEPIISAGGLIAPPPEYFQRLKALCEERGMYLIFDEAQTGLGRTGSNFAFEQLGVIPDFLTLSKTLGGGLPLSATITSREIEEDCFEKGFVHVTSHVADPLPAAAGLAVIRILIRDKLAERAKKMGEYLRKGLMELHQRHEVIGDVRGMGLLLGVELVRDRHKREPFPEFGKGVTRRCLDLGLSMNIVSLPGMASVWRLAPPLTVTTEEIDLGLAILEQAIEDELDEKSPA